MNLAMVLGILVLQLLPAGRVGGGDHVATEGLAPSVDAQLAQIYGAIGRDITRAAARAFDDLATRPRSAEYRLLRQRMLADELGAISARTGTAVRVMDAAAKAAVTRATRTAEGELAALGLDAKQRITFAADGRPRPASAAGLQFGGIDEGALRAVAEDTAARAVRDSSARLGGAVQQHAERARTIFRDLSSSVLTSAGNAQAEARINSAIARALGSGDPRIAQRAIREEIGRDLGVAIGPNGEGLRALGNQLIEVGSATMSVRAYAATVTRTRMREATVAARHARLDASGIDLVQIVGSQSDNWCTEFVGLVCGLHGEVARDGVVYPALSSLPEGGPPFHPNCTKSTVAYIAYVASSEMRDRHQAALARWLNRDAA